MSQSEHVHVIQDSFHRDVAAVHCIFLPQQMLSLTTGNYNTRVLPFQNRYESVSSRDKTSTSWIWLFDNFGTEWREVLEDRERIDRTRFAISSDGAWWMGRLGRRAARWWGRRRLRSGDQPKYWPPSSIHCEWRRSRTLRLWTQPTVWRYVVCRRIPVRYHPLDVRWLHRSDAWYPLPTPTSLKLKSVVS